MHASHRSLLLPAAIGFSLLTSLLVAMPRARAAVQRETLWGSVAVSLGPALRHAANRFTVMHPSIRIRINTGGSGVLVQQLRSGTPADLFISASPQEIDALEKEGLVRAGTRLSLASNRLVIVVPAGDVAPRSVQDLTKDAFDLVAVGNPRTAPLGRYTVEALSALNLLDHLRSRLVPAENARQVLEYVARGEVAAGVVYGTDALLYEERVDRGPEFAMETHSAVLYQSVVLEASHAPDSARAFLDWLSSTEGFSILARFGFSPPD